MQFRPLPGYDDASSTKGVAKGSFKSLRVWWKLLGEVDGVWLLGPNPLGFAFAALARLRGRSVALGVRQDLPSYARNRHPQRRAVHLVAQILECGWQALARTAPTVVVGTELAQRYRHAPRLLDARISLISAAQIATPARDWEGPLEILSVGRLDAEKNPLLLADILALLPPRVSLTVCGDGALAAPLKERLDPTRSRMLGSLPRDELLEVYRRAHILLHVSHTEGVPQVLFEAFAGGLPVVATDVGGVKDAADGAALLIGPDDARAAAAAIERLIDDPQLRLSLIERGRQRAAATTIERCAGEVARLIDPAAATYSSSR